MRNLIRKVSEESLSNLPPPVRRRLRRILTNHAEQIPHQRASVVQERRGDGRRFWRLYLESGSGRNRHRKRVYVGPVGGPELRRAMKALRRAFWGKYGGRRSLMAALLNQMAEESREARRGARSTREAVLAQTCRRAHGQTVRTRRDVPAVERYRTEYRHLSRKALEKATWPGITEDEYVDMRRAVERTRSGPRISPE